MSELDPVSATQPEAESLTPPPQHAGKLGLWLEVLAVLAIGALPDLSSAVVGFYAQPAPLPYWLDAVDLTWRSACISFAVLYVMSRSASQWADFGLVRPRLVDLLLGFGLWVIFELVWRVTSQFVPEGTLTGDDFFTRPQCTGDMLLMFMSKGANGFTEELVTRAYLITRLRELLGSKVAAVMISAAIFASYHLYYGLWGAFEILVAGFVYGCGFLLFRRVWPCAAAHMFHGIVAEMPWMG